MERKVIVMNVQESIPVVRALSRTRVKRASARPKRRLLRGRPGFSLIEIMVVVIIIGLLMGGVGFGVFQYLRRARVKTTEQALDILRSSVRMYQNDHPGQCPTTEQLQAEGFLDRNRSTNDGWGRPFHIECNGDEVAVRSDGADGRAGTEDDIPAGGGQSGSGGGGGR